MTTKTRKLPTWMSPAFPIVLGILAGAKMGLAPQIFRFMFKKAVFQQQPLKMLDRRGARAGDVYIATWAKSGTNWLMQIAQQIAWRGQVDYERLHDMVPWPEAPGPFAIRLKDADRQVRSPEGSLVIKSHLYPHQLPYSEEACYITAVRDPKEVCVSAYHFFLGLMQLTEHIDKHTWLDMYLQDDFLGDMWARHLASAWEGRERANCLVMTFDEMKADLPGTVDRVARAMGVQLSPADRSRVIARCTFEYMRDNESRFAPPVLPLMGINKRPKMIRQGATGRSGDMFTLEEQARIDAFSSQRLRALGCDFPYGQHFSRG